MALMCPGCRAHSAPAAGAGVASVGIGLGIINPDPLPWSLLVLPSFLDRSTARHPCRRSRRLFPPFVQGLGAVKTGNPTRLPFSALPPSDRHQLTRSITTPTPPSTVLPTRLSCPTQLSCHCSCSDSKGLELLVLCQTLSVAVFSTPTSCSLPTLQLDNHVSPSLNPSAHQSSLLSLLH